MLSSRLNLINSKIQKFKNKLFAFLFPKDFEIKI